MTRSFGIGELYRDTGSYRNANDQFLRWIRGPLDSGIRNSGGIRDVDAEGSDVPAALVLVSNDSGVSQHDDPWEDTLAVDAGYISYWGDAKPGKPYDEAGRSGTVRDVFDRAASGRREEVPPVLVFHKPERGAVRFCGLCVPDYFEVRSYEHRDSGRRVPNYLFHFVILNTPSVPVPWLHDRAQMDGNERAPDVWTEWVRTGNPRQWPTGEPLHETEGRLRRYETTETTVSEAFRAETFDRYNHACTITGIEEEPLLDLAHILPRSERPDLAEHPENVLVLNSLHHRAFDAGLFTIDTDYRVRVSPSFDPGHPFLRETIIEQQEDRLELPPDVRLRAGFIEDLNADRSWF